MPTVCRPHRTVAITSTTSGGHLTGGRRQGRVGATTVYEAVVNGEQVFAYSRSGLVAQIDLLLDETAEERTTREARKAALTASLSA